MKYTVASGDCCSPKSPTVVIFPPFGKINNREPLNLQTSHGEPHGNRKIDMTDSHRSSSYATVQAPLDHFRPEVHSPHVSPRICPAPQYPCYTCQNGQRKDQLENNYTEKRRNFSSSRDSLGSHHNRLNDNEEAPHTGNLSITSRMSIIIVGLIVILCCVVSFAALIMNIRQQTTIKDLQTTTENLRSALAQAAESPKLCLPCGDLSLGPFPEDTPELDELIKQDENGQHICCAKTTKHMSVFLNLFAKRKQMEKCAQEIINAETKPSAMCNTSGTPGSPSIPAKGNSFGNISAHLQAGTQPANLVSDVPIRNWSIGLVAPGTHLTNINLSSDNHSLVIPESGRYFLYSQVGFLIYYNEDTQPDPQKGAQSLFHSVYRYNVIYPLGDQELLRSDLTQCWEQKKDYGRYTSYVGASVQLNKGDLVYVKVSKIELLARGEPGVTYFGLFKIG